MKKSTIIISILFTVVHLISAQIPNGGFEDWPLTSNGWPVSTGVQSTDHYPTGVGSYSVMVQNNMSINTMYKFGFVNSAFYPGYNGPTFPITGHPNKLCGYYKFFPQNGDTLNIGVALYKNGELVAGAQFTNKALVSEWTEFSVPISSYTEADSAQVGFGAFYSEYGKMPLGPYGNSILYVDNLSFDNFVTAVPQQTSAPKLFNLYPNPASDIITLTSTGEGILTVYNIAGTLVKSETLTQNQQQIDISNLPCGVYTVQVKSGNTTETQKLIIQR